jgi:hypothetical protein
MLKTRIGKWKLDKKLKLPDMRSAMQLVADHHYEEHESEVVFLIRGRVVPYSKVLQYFVRKGVSDPLQWLRALPEDGFVPSSDVELIGPSNGAATLEPTGAEAGLDRLYCSDGPAGSKAGALQAVQGRTKDCIQPSGSFLRQADPMPSLVIPLTSQPFAFSGPERLIYTTNSYCAMYLTSSRSSEHREPAVHHLTTHAIFAQRMQDGVALLLRNEVDLAFQDFDSAFALLRPVIGDNHPMSVCLVLAVVCELESKDFGPLVVKLLQHTARMCSIALGAFDPLTILFRALAEVEYDAIDMTLLVVRRAADSLTEFRGSPVWKSLYLRERLCDCLYYARHDQERVSKRRTLLQEQDELYGPNSRNVLWTLTNIADDCLQLGTIEEAEACFNMVLARSQTLSGYGRAKSRFAALEGLAKCALAKSNVQEGLKARFSSGEHGMCPSEIDRALHLLDQAETEARLWFPPSSRRTARVQATIREVESMSIVR